MATAFSSPALAHKVVHVQGTLYVIICEPSGDAFTFNGTTTGAGQIGSNLCPTAALNTGGTTSTCPKGTHWYEPAKACVANGGHPTP